MSMIPIEEKVYGEGLTKQSFKDSCDINMILKKAQRTGTISHLAKHGPEYGDFAAFDFFETQNKIARGKSIFEALPSEIRREFDQDPGLFFEYVNDPANAGRLSELLPGIAKPGNQIVKGVVRGAAAAAPSEPVASVSPQAATPLQGGSTAAATGA